MIHGYRRLILTAALAFGCGLPIASVPTRPAKAATVYDRLLQLEQKTNYFKKINKKIVKRYVRPAGALPASTSQAGQCLPNGLQMKLDPLVTVGGSAYTWVTTTIDYAGVPIGEATGEPLFATFWKADNATYPCGKAFPISHPYGTFTLKQFCSFDVSSGDKFTMQVVVQGFSGDGSHCVEDYVRSVTATAKFTLIGIVEPP